MEGWRQRRLGSKEDHSTTKGNYKTDLTLTGLLMEGLVAKVLMPDRARKSPQEEPRHRKVVWMASLRAPSQLFNRSGRSDR